MIHEVAGGLWVHSQDLMADVPGREDSAEDKEACAQFLVQRDQRVSSSSAMKTQSALAAAHVRSFVFGRHMRDADLDQLSGAQKAIDRLLAFVPARAAAVSEARLNEIAEALSAAAQEAFTTASRIFVSIAPENDSETEACHRLTIRVVLGAAADPTSAAAGIVTVHRRLTAVADVAERRAILLVVNPDSAAA
jgi:hypothetical protein